MLTLPKSVNLDPKQLEKCLTKTLLTLTHHSGVTKNIVYDSQNSAKVDLADQTVEFVSKYSKLDETESMSYRNRLVEHFKTIEVDEQGHWRLGDESAFFIDDYIIVELSEVPYVF